MSREPSGVPIRTRGGSAWFVTKDPDLDYVWPGMPGPWRRTVRLQVTKSNGMFTIC